MKARIKETGEIVDIENLYDDGTALIVDGGYIRVSKLEFIENEKVNGNIDSEWRRYELAKEYSKVFISLQHEQGRVDCGCYVTDIVKWSVEFADALIEELKKESN
jgi:hypothetical protein